MYFCLFFLHNLIKFTVNDVNVDVQRRITKGHALAPSSLGGRCDNRSMADATIGYNRRMILDQAMQEHQQVQQKSRRTKKRIETT